MTCSCVCASHLLKLQLCTQDHSLSLFDMIPEFNLHFTTSFKYTRFDHFYRDITQPMLFLNFSACFCPFNIVRIMKCQTSSRKPVSIFCSLCFKYMDYILTNDSSFILVFNRSNFSKHHVEHDNLVIVQN